MLYIFVIAINSVFSRKKKKKQMRGNLDAWEKTNKTRKKQQQRNELNLRQKKQKKSIENLLWFIVCFIVQTVNAM